MSATLAELHTAEVLAMLGRSVRPCAECGTPMTTGTGFDGAPSRGIDVFTPLAADGSTTGPAVDLVHLFDPSANWLGAANPYAYLARLGELCSEATSVKRRETAGLYERTIREYAALKVRLDTGFTFHRHEPEHEPWVYDPDRAPLGKVLPYHCGQPAWLRPSGWYCRGCRVLLTDESAELRDV